MPVALTTRRAVLGLTGLGAAGIAFGAWQLRPALTGDGRLTAPEALARVRDGSLLLVDIRRPDEWRETGVAEGAERLDLRAPDFTEKLSALMASRPGQPVAVICARGVRSRRTAARLEEAGLGPILDVPEGMLGSAAGPGWLKRGLPVVADAGGTG